MVENSRLNRKERRRVAFPGPVPYRTCIQSIEGGMVESALRSLYDRTGIQNRGNELSALRDGCEEGACESSGSGDPGCPDRIRVGGVRRDPDGCGAPGGGDRKGGLQGSSLASA